MGWRSITRPDYTESHLQALFTQGRTPAIAGEPAWMQGWQGATQRPSRRYHGIRFQTDAEWLNGSTPMLAELKYAPKYQPLALAEVLFHAEACSRLGPAVTPVIVESEDIWTRAAINHLFANGYQGPLRHIEVDLLGDTAASSPEIVWFREPRATMTATANPPAVPELDVDPGLTWYEVAGAATWILTPAAPTTPILTERTVMLSRVRLGTSFEWILWTGHLPGPDDAWTSRQWLKCGEYFCFDIRAPVQTLSLGVTHR